MQKIAANNDTPQKNYYYSINKQIARALFAMYAIAWNNDCAFVSGKKRPLGEQIRSVHIDYYSKLLDLLQQQLYDRQKYGNMQPDEYLKLSINSVKLSLYCNVDERTIRNYNARLIRCGVLEKTNHGHELNYDLIFNNWLVSPMVNVNGKVSMGKYEFFNAFNDLADIAGRKTMPAMYSYLRIHFNNKLINKEPINQQYEPTIHRLITPADLSALFLCYRNTEHILYRYQGNTEQQNQPFGIQSVCCAAPEQKTANKQPEKPTEQRIGNLRRFSSTDMSVLRLAYAGSIYSYAIDLIPGWNDNVFESVHGRVPYYIANNYLANIQTKAELDRYYNDIARPSIEAAAELIKKKIASGKWPKYNVYPDSWFDVTYPKGFVASAKYVKIKFKKLQRTADELNRLEDLDKLNKILVEYYTSKTDNYYNLLDRVRVTIPHRERQFKFCIKNNLKQAERYWIVGEANQVIIDKSKAS
ncbi:MAG: hypothetical protein EOM76_07205 [Sphingobacteriia bacterium]|nr:hypothetical protein [Sphingobacteriia bacterium]